MDLTDKINELQYYSYLPFGELYKDSLFLNSVLNLSTERAYLNPSYSFDTISLDMTPMISFRLEIEGKIATHLIENKKHIILKYRGDYILFKNISSVLLRSSDNPYFPNVSYNYGGYFRNDINRIYTNSNRTIVTGYTEEIKTEPIENLIDVIKQINSY